MSKPSAPPPVNTPPAPPNGKTPAPPPAGPAPPPTAGSPPASGKDPAPAPPPGLDAEHHRTAQRAALTAEKIATGFFPALLSMALSADGSAVDAYACQVYLDRVKDAYGHPTDPTVVVMIEQFTLAHLRAARLHADAAAATDVERIKVLTGAAARLHAELRRTAAVLHELVRQAPAGERLKIAKTG